MAPIAISNGASMPKPLPPFDLPLLRSFLMVLDSGSFTIAAQRLGLSQSTVSLQVGRLEAQIGKTVLLRGRQGLRPTFEGEVLASFARRILALSDEARLRLTEPVVGGTVRLGTPEDFATVHLPDILAQFTREHPAVLLEVNCDFTVNLLDAFARGQYDLVLVKRERQGAGGGVTVFREVLQWVGKPDVPLSKASPVPLVMAPAPDLYRKRAITALDHAGRPWRIAYTSSSLAGLQAAVTAGLGVTVMPREMMPAGLTQQSEETGLPALEDAEIVLYRAPGQISNAASLLEASIIRSLTARDAPLG